MEDQKIWKCNCGNQDRTKNITAPDGEIVCGVCGTVLGEVTVEARVLESKEQQNQSEGWNGETDLCRKLLEDRVSRKGWEF